MSPLRKVVFAAEMMAWAYCGYWAATADALSNDLVSSDRVAAVTWSLFGEAGSEIVRYPRSCVKHGEAYTNAECISAPGERRTSLTADDVGVPEPPICSR